MNLTRIRKEKKFSKLIDLGTLGHFPLFHHQWLLDLSQGQLGPNSQPLRDEARFISLLEKLTPTRSIEKQKVILEALSPSDRALFITSFLKLVEARILDANPTLQ